MSAYSNQVKLAPPLPAYARGEFCNIGPLFGRKLLGTSLAALLPPKTPERNRCRVLPGLFWLLGRYFSRSLICDEFGDLIGV